MGVRWIRLDTTWSQSEWIAELPAPSRLAWVELLCFVKSHGIAGSVKKPGIGFLSSAWGISRNAIEAMFTASFQDGAVVMDGKTLIITGWGERQMDPKASERMRAYRERLKREKPDPAPPPVATVTRNKPPPVTRNKKKPVTAVTRNKRNAPPRAPAPDRDRDIDTDTHPPRPTPARKRAHEAREDDSEIEREIKKHLLDARTNIVAIHGGTEETVTIEGHEVGVGLEIDVYKRLCREGRDPPDIIAAAIAHIPTVSDLQPPVSLARWGAKDGMPIYEQCVGMAYKEVSP